MSFQKIMEDSHCAIYEEGGRIEKGRVIKECACCGVTIPKGSAATTFKMVSGTDFFPWYICDTCTELPDYKDFEAGEFNKY